MAVSWNCCSIGAERWSFRWADNRSDGSGRDLYSFELHTSKTDTTGQDEIYLQVIRTSGETWEQKNAASVLRLLKKGKHWVLVSLLLSNVITNETLPIVLDRSLGGGWPAVLGSTALIGM